VVHLVVLACVLRSTTKKGRQLFYEKRAPPEKILATPMPRPVFRGGGQWDDNS